MDLQKIMIKQLIEYLKQLVSLYKYMLCEHGFKNLMIRPQSILESNGTLKVFDLNLNSSLQIRNDNKENWRKYCELFSEKFEPVDRG